MVHTPHRCSKKRNDAPGSEHASEHFGLELVHVIQWCLTATALLFFGFDRGRGDSEDMCQALKLFHESEPDHEAVHDERCICAR